MEEGGRVTRIICRNLNRADELKRGKGVPFGVVVLVFTCEHTLHSSI